MYGADNSCEEEKGLRGFSDLSKQLSSPTPTIFAWLNHVHLSSLALGNCSSKKLS